MSIVEIGENSHLTRQMDLIPAKVLDKQINIIGAGAVGSFTTLALVKMGFTNINVIDFDVIDIENMNCQFFRFKDIGKYKVDALKELVLDFTNVEINVANDRWNGAILDGVTICAADSMVVRKQLFDTHERKAFQTQLIIDPRMGAETALLHTYSPLNPKEISEYQKTLYSDSEAIQEACTRKATIYTALSLAGIVCTVVKQFLVDGVKPKSILYDIPSHDMITHM